MDNRDEVRDFLTTRRARVTPDAVGLPAGGARRVPGLRRSEVAALAGVSVEYYARLERGALAGVSGAVLDGIATALRLDEAERSHLVDLARAADGSASVDRPRRRATPRTARPALQWVIEAYADGPAVVRSGRLEVVALNAMARAFYDGMLEPGGNLARFQFLDPRSRDFYPEWEAMADVCVAQLRREAARDPYDRDLHDLVGELSTRSDEFRTRWGAHDVRRHGSGVKHFRHPVVGELHLTFERVELVDEPGLTITLYAAEPGTADAERLRLLASWSAPVAALASDSPALDPPALDSPVLDSPALDPEETP